MLKVILVEDDDYDAELIIHEVKKVSKDIKYRIVKKLEEFKGELKSFSPDIILTDYMLPDSNGMDVMNFSKVFAPNIPLIIVTGSINEETATSCMKAGASDYVLKEHLIHLGPSIKHAIKNKKTESEKLAVEENLRKSEANLKATVLSLRQTLEEIIAAIAKIVEFKDPYTAGHQQRVAELASKIAKELNMNSMAAYSIKLASLIHDVGKINIPASILTKPGILNSLEFELIKTHSEIGYEIIKQVHFPWPIAKIILQHHERLDGSGYPQNLKDNEIIKEAKICAVADVVEAMASHRPYRPALGINEALDEIKSKSGILYDREVVQACVGLFKNKKYRFLEIST